MRRNTGQVMAVLGLLLLGACSDGEDARSLGPVATAPSTTVATTTTTTLAPATTTSTTARVVTTTCNNVGFTPSSDDVASLIVATGVGCAEAEALVRKVGAQVGATGGPSRVEADGWVCLRVRQSDGPGLPSSDFECTSGSKNVTFHRV